MRAGNLALHVGDDPRQVDERRRDVESTVGLGDARFQYMNQVHGNDVAVISRYGPGPTADAMVSTSTSTSTSGAGSAQPLAVMVADCVPIVLVGETAAGQPVLAVAHAGRPGVASGVVPATVAGMRRLGALTISAWLGPSICGRCYEVPAEMRAGVAAVVPATASETSWGSPALDLPAGVRSQLADGGVQVEYSGGCTLEDEGLFSYRRDPGTGRFAGLVWTHD